MNYEVSYHDYRELCALSSQKVQNNCDTYSKCIDALFTHWTNKLGHDKICVLGFILSRTLKYGKIAAGIPFPAFLGGVCSEEQGRAITSALSMSKNTLRRVLKELVEEGFLHVFFPEKRRGVLDNFTRYFEIDFKKLLHLGSKGSQIMTILRQPKAKKVSSDEPENTLRTPRKARNSGLPNLGDLSIPYKKTSKDVSTAEDGGKDEQEPSVIKRITRSVRPTVQQLRDKLDAMQQQMREKRAAKAKAAATKPARGLTQADVQALFDRAVTHYAPNGPRVVVTGKAFGAMRNHLKRNSPADFADFVNWTVAEWTTLATRHAQHVRKQAKSGEGLQESIPRAPNFNAFGYRMPYFLAAYNNAKLDTSLWGSEQERQKAAIAKANRAADAAKKEAESLRALLAKQKRIGTATERQSSEAPAVSNTPRRPALDNELPTWEQKQNQGE